MIKTVITDLVKLSDRADEVDVLKENKLVRETVLDLKHTMQANNYTHLTAPQIGVNKRIMCINFSGDIRTMINPVTSGVKGFVLSRETDASLPNQEFILPRNAEMSMIYQTPTGKVQSNTFKGKAAFVAQSAMQVLDGLFISDVGLPLLDGWDDLDESDKDAIIADYLQSLDIKQKDVEKAIKEDDMLKQTYDAINFMRGVATGEVELDNSSTPANESTEEDTDN